MNSLDTSDSFDTFDIFWVDLTDWLDSDSCFDTFDTFGSCFDTYDAWFDPVWIPAVSGLILLKMGAKTIPSGDHFTSWTLAFQRSNGTTFFWYLFSYRWSHRVIFPLESPVNNLGNFSLYEIAVIEFHS